MVIVVKLFLSDLMLLFSFSSIVLIIPFELRA
jgi:hypothetical protein